jgi:SAM-dependent methyltransferase
MEILFFLILALVFFSAAYAALSSAPWVPITKKDIPELFEIAGVKRGGIFVDIGCGDGRILKIAQERCMRGRGYEISFLFYLIAKLRFLFSPSPRPEIFFKSFWSADISDADIVFFFLTPRVYEKVGEKLFQELKSGACVISYVWPIPRREPFAVRKKEGYPPIYFYRVFR